jgi:predicted lipoprotein with Yx(FWY)xxD motif
MTRRSPINFLAGAAAVPIVALAVAGCGNGSSSATASASPAPPKTTSGSPATIGAAKTGLGTILVDSQGRTVYLFQKDVGTKSACSGACAAAWPPVIATGKPTVGTGLNASLVGTSRRSGGASQVTYNGHPLYRFVKDQKPGDTNGQGVTAFGGGWFALTATGTQVSGSGTSSSSGGSSSPSAGGY